MAAVTRLSLRVVTEIKSFMLGFRRMRKRLRKFSRTVGRVGAGLKRLAKGFAALAVVGVGALTKLAFAGEHFNRAMRRSQSIMGDLSNTMKNKMARAALEAARTTEFSSKQAAESFFFLASAGLTAEQSLAALPKVALFAQAGMFDMALATDLLTDAQSALGLTVDDVQQNMTNMVRVSDVLVRANELANATVQQFSEALTTKAGAALKIWGKDLEEGVAVLAAFADQGIKASDAGTGLNIVIRDLTTKAFKNAAAFKKHNIVVFDAAGKFRNLADIIGDIEKRLAGMTDLTKKATFAQLGFADKSVVFIQTLIGMSERIRGYERNLRAAGGATKTVADKILTPFQKSVAALGAAWVDLANTMKPVIDVMALGINDLAGAMERLKGSFKQAAVLDALAAGLNSAEVALRTFGSLAVVTLAQVTMALRTMVKAFGDEDAAKSLKETAIALADLALSIINVDKADMLGNRLRAFAERQAGAEQQKAKARVKAGALKAAAAAAISADVTVAEDRQLALLRVTRGAISPQGRVNLLRALQRAQMKEVRGEFETGVEFAARRMRKREARFAARGKVAPLGPPVQMKRGTVDRFIEMLELINDPRSGALDSELEHLRRGRQENLQGVPRDFQFGDPEKINRLLDQLLLETIRTNTILQSGVKAKAG